MLELAEHKGDDAHMMTNSLFYVKDYRNPNITDSEAIERCFLDANKGSGEKTVVFDGEDYRIDRAILIDSNTTVIIDNCTIKQNDFVFDNMFRGDNLIINGIDPYGAPLNVTPVSNIKIIGKGEATIIGTDKSRVAYHPFFKEYQQMNGDFWGWRTHMFSFSCAVGMEIANLKLRQTMCWAVSFDNCQQVHVHDIDIRSNVKNGDGIDFRSGCNHCVAENITGFTSDDTVACTALSLGKRARPLSKYLSCSEPYNASHENVDGNIHHITIRNIHTGGHHHGVICLSARGNQVYDIDIENVVETGEGDREATVKIYTGYGDGYNKGDIHDIRVNNVVSEKAKYAVMVACDAENLTLENIAQNNPDCKLIFEK